VKARFITLLTLLCIGRALGASAQASDPQESRMGAELRLEEQDLAKDCDSFKTIVSCATDLATEHPFHVSMGSIAPQNGLGAGPAMVTHFTPQNWRITWSGDGVYAPGGAWRAGTYLTMYRTKIAPPQLAQPGARVQPIRITETAVYDIYAQTMSLPTINFYGVGADTSVANKTAYRMSETLVGGSASIPLGAAANTLRLNVLLEANGRMFNIRDAAMSDGPSISTRFDEATAPGLVTQPSFTQFGEGVRMHPLLFGDRLQLGYTLQYEQFVSTQSSSSFERWSVDLAHQIQLYHTGGGPVVRDERNTPDDCSSSPSEPACPSVTRDRWGSINIRALVSKSIVGSGATVPFYLQHTLGGSDIDGARALASYDDYRFRGPHLMLFQESLEHSIWGPLGASLLFEQGKVMSQDAKLSVGGLRQSVGVGATLRAGGFPAVTASWYTGGPEGNHFIFTLDTSLLGGGSRPSLQ
jgi:hypothetical protein